MASTGSSAGDWQQRLRSSGHRLTPQRELVLAAVEHLGHATPDEVFAEVRTHSDSINQSTVYRTLELLDELGLIRHVHLSDRAPTYHSARGLEHAHLVCRNCGTVATAPAASPRSGLRVQTKFQTRVRPDATASIIR